MVLEMWLNKAKRSKPGPDLGTLEVTVKKTILTWIRKNTENYESTNLKAEGIGKQRCKTQMAYRFLS